MLKIFGDVTFSKARSFLGYPGIHDRFLGCHGKVPLESPRLVVEVEESLPPDPPKVRNGWDIGIGACLVGGI